MAQCNTLTTIVMVKLAVVAWGDRYSFPFTHGKQGMAVFLDLLMSRLPGVPMRFLDVRDFVPGDPGCARCAKGAGKGKKKGKQGNASPTGRRDRCSTLEDATRAKDISNDNNNKPKCTQHKTKTTKPHRTIPALNAINNTTNNTNKNITHFGPGLLAADDGEL